MLPAAILFCGVVFLGQGVLLGAQDLTLLGVGYTALWSAGVLLVAWMPGLPALLRLLFLGNLFLQAVGTALTHTLSPDPWGRIWTRPAIEVLLVFLACVAGAAWGNRTTLDQRLRLSAWLEEYGAWVAVCLLVLNVSMWFVPFLRYQAWTACMVSALVGGAILSGRIGAHRAVPSSPARWLTHWRPAIFMVALPTAVLLNPLANPDFTPAVLIGLLFLAMLIALGQWKASITIALMALTLAYGAYTLRASTVLARRVDNWRAPTAGISSQQIEGIWSVCRGHLVGLGIGHAISPSGESVAGFTSQQRRITSPPLAATDGIFATAFQAFGVIGGTLLLLWVAMPGMLLFHLASKTNIPTARAWLAGVATLYAAMMALTVMWPLGQLPILGAQAPYVAGGRIGGFMWCAIMGTSAVIPVLFPATSPPNIRVQQTGRHGLTGMGIAFAIVLFIACLGLWRLGWLAREELLACPYQGNFQESWAREAALRQWVICRDGRAQVNPAIRPDTKKEQQRLQKYLEQGHFVIDHQRVTVNSSFRQFEPTLGLLYYYARKSRAQKGQTP